MFRAVALRRPFLLALNIPCRNCKAVVFMLRTVLQSCPMPGLRGRLCTQSARTSSEQSLQTARSKHHRTSFAVAARDADNPIKGPSQHDSNMVLKCLLSYEIMCLLEREAKEIRLEEEKEESVGRDERKKPTDSGKNRISRARRAEKNRPEEEKEESVGWNGRKNPDRKRKKRNQSGGTGGRTPTGRGKRGISRAEWAEEPRPEAEKVESVGWNARKNPDR